MKQPESIYVSRQEVLNNLQFPKQNSSSKSSAKIHDSWSSRASSILAKGSGSLTFELIILFDLIK